MHNKIFFGVAAGVILLIGAYLFIAHESRLPVLYVSEESEEAPAIDAVEGSEGGEETKNRMNQASDDVDDKAMPIQSTYIEVYISGSVMKPGVYSFEEGARVTDGLDKAGGLSEEAATSAVNLARLMEDGEQIYFPTEDEVSNGYRVGDGLQEDASKPINLNRASLNELMEIPGVGEAKGKAIIQYREEQGAFGTVEELMQVPGIKEASFEQMQSYICVN